MVQQRKIPCTIMRGGTSKGVFFHSHDLPTNRDIRDQVLLAVFGSPDPKQIDGLGGANSLTSKVAIVSPSDDPGIDVNYTFGQVKLEEPFVDYGGNCGNISAAVGPFAIDESLVNVSEPVTVVKILNTNTGKMIEAEVPVVEDKASIEGDLQISGVPNRGAKIRLAFVDPGGSVTGRLLPTGQPKDVIEVSDYGVIEASIVDAGNPCVFVRAADLGLTATESPAEIDELPGVLNVLEKIRSIVAAKIGLVDEAEIATEISPSVPKIAIVGPPVTYELANGMAIDAEKIDLVTRIMSMQRCHQAYALTGAIALVAAAGLADTIVAEIVGVETKEVNRITLGHSAGTMTLESIIESGTDIAPKLVRVVAERTARRIMDGSVYIHERLWEA